MRAYLEVRDTSGRLSSVFIEVLMPARITELDFDGSLLTVEAIAAKGLDGVRSFLTKRAPDGLAVLEHREVLLRATGEREDFVVQRGSIELEANQNELIEIVLTHSVLPELDEMHRLRTLLVGRLVFTPRQDEKGWYYEFAGQGSISTLLAGVVLPKVWWPQRDSTARRVRSRLTSRASGSPRSAPCSAPSRAPFRTP